MAKNYEMKTFKFTNKDIKINTKILLPTTILTNIKKNKNTQCWQGWGEGIFIHYQ